MGQSCIQSSAKRRVTLMANHEDLYRELQAQETHDDELYEQQYAKKAAKKVPQVAVDSNAAAKRYNEEILPVIQARRRVAQGLPPTNNPIKNLILKVTNKDKFTELSDIEIVEPTTEFIQVPKKQ